MIAPHNSELEISMALFGADEAFDIEESPRKNAIEARRVLSKLIPVFSWRCSSEKCPTITVASFFQLTISLWMVHFSYNSYNLTISYNSYLAYEVVFLHHLRNSTGPKGTPLEYFRLCETFFENKNFPCFNFWRFAKEWMLEKPQGVPPFSFFGIVRFFSENKNFSAL